jgi:glucose/arabinose dehydrogenase
METQIVSGLSGPTAMAFAPDGRIFVCQQGGQLRVIKNGVLLSTPFISLSVDSSGERGLLGIAFDPNFAVNNWLYVYYTVSAAPQHNRISRFTANGDVALGGSEVVLLDLDNLTTATNHNGGAIHFGLDGKLYAGVGENANGSNSQTLSNLLGKMLRINSDGTIPSDNPFFNTATGKNRAIWALGLRNPFTFAVEPGTGRIFINDVGENTWEEINDGIAGSNYGWPTTEGATSNPAFRSPLLVYGHGSSLTQGCAITGGAFYRPQVNQYPAGYPGMYFFADLCSNWIRKFDPVTSTSTIFATGVSVPVDIQLGLDDNLYYLARGTGSVHRISYVPGFRTPTAGMRTSTGVIQLVPDSSNTVRPSSAVFSSNPGIAQNPSGDTFAAARDSFGAMWVNAYNATTQNWNSWAYGGAVLKGTPAIVMANDATAYICARDNFNSYWIATYVNGSGFSSWTYLAGIFATDPVMAISPNGTAFIAGRDNFGSLWSGRYLAGLGFQGWQYGAGIVKGTPSIAVGTDGIAYISARDNFNAIWMARVQGDTWLGWTYGGGVLSSDPQLAASGDGSIYAGILDPGNGVWYRSYAEGSANGWQTWINANGTLSSMSVASSGGNLYIAGKDSTNATWWFRSGQSLWRSAGNLGGAELSAAPR